MTFGRKTVIQATMTHRGRYDHTCDNILICEVILMTSWISLVHHSHKNVRKKYCSCLTSDANMHLHI